MVFGELEETVVNVKAGATFLRSLARSIELVLGGDEAIDSDGHFGAGDVMPAAEKPYRFAVNRVTQRIGAADFEIKVGQRLKLLEGAPVGTGLAIERINAKVMIHHETQPKTQFADFRGAALQVHSVEHFFDDALLIFVEPIAVAFDGILATGAGFSKAEEIEQFVKQANREGSKSR